MGNGSLPPEGQKPKYPDLHARFKNRNDDQQDAEPDIMDQAKPSDSKIVDSGDETENKRISKTD